jgi:hypothetical protein
LPGGVFVPSRMTGVGARGGLIGGVFVPSRMTGVGATGGLIGRVPSAVGGGEMDVSTGSVTGAVGAWVVVADPRSPPPTASTTVRAPM